MHAVKEFTPNCIFSHFAKLSPSPSSSGAELALFPVNPTTHPHPHPPPPTRESFFSAASNYDGSTVEHSLWPHHKLATHKHFPLSQFLTQAGLLTIIMVIFLSDPTLAY